LLQGRQGLRDAVPQLFGERVDVHAERLPHFARRRRDLRGLEHSGALHCVRVCHERVLVLEGERGHVPGPVQQIAEDTSEDGVEATRRCAGNENEHNNSYQNADPDNPVLHFLSRRLLL
jgi:hypothetical protein